MQDAAGTMRFFTVEGANKLIPQLTKYIDEIRDLKEKILQKQVQIDTHLIVAGVSEPTTYAASQGAVGKDVQELNQLIGRFKGILQEITALGGQLKDLDAGLVDFFHIHNDEIVNLCWKYGESGIGFWHTLDNGYQGRQKL